MSRRAARPSATFRSGISPNARRDLLCSLAVRAGCSSEILRPPRMLMPRSSLSTRDSTGLAPYQFGFRVIAPALVAFGAVFIAEMADKTQLATIALATRFRLGTVLAGLALGSVAVMGLSAGIGAAAGAALPTRAIGIGAGVAFVGVGLWMVVSGVRARRSVGQLAGQSEGQLAGQSEGQVAGDTAAPAADLPGSPEDAGSAVTARRKGAGSALVVAGTFVAAELGDKTMLAALTLASKGNAVAVWVGGAVALFVVDAIAAALGDVLSRYLSPRVVTPIAGGLFLAAGAWMLWDALGS
ncbi:MAG: hypothetical protein DCC49_06555 [Acidobacteria bacterium]|nr:MAG: hypothetical protein DCC49_06555 [Acidobacteriota bacterium]